MGSANCERMSSPELQPDTAYYLGVWRRTPFDVAAWPMCLNANNGTAACLGGYDADSGNMWNLIPCQANDYMIVCIDSGESKYLGDDLKMKRNKEGAAVFTAEAARQFRGGPLDSSVSFSNHKGQLLCSKDATRQIALLTAQEAEEKDANGEFIWNNSWECSPDVESEEDDEFLSQYMTVSRFT